MSLYFNNTLILFILIESLLSIKVLIQYIILIRIIKKNNNDILNF